MQIDDEKKIVKNQLCIAYYPEMSKIMLRTGGLFLALEVISGNEEEFIGEYKVSFFGQEGDVVIK